MIPVANPICWQRTDIDGCAVVTPDGELTTARYARFRDDLVRLATERPRAVIVVLDDLRLSTASLVTAFSAARARVGRWPGVPIALVVASPRRRAQLDGLAGGRLPVFATVAAAVAATAVAEAEPVARRAALGLAAAPSSARRARRFVREMCDGWCIRGARADAQLVASELVENALIHGRGEPRLHLELREGTLTVAVSDGEPREAVLRERTDVRRDTSGLHVVAALATAWGSAPHGAGGKVVWASLPIARCVTARH